MCAENATTSLGDCLVVGLGTTAAGVARYLASLMPGTVRSLTVVGGASSQDGPLAEELKGLGATLVLGTEKIEGSYDVAVISPGIPEHSSFYKEAKAHATELMSDPELAWRMSPERWIAITGTNGKTTTTSLAAHLLTEAGLSARAVGNIGVSACECVPSRGEAEWFVAELSSFQLASSSRLHPRVACLTNITPDHLDWHGGFEGYVAAKEKVFDNLGAGDLAVIGAGPECDRIADKLGHAQIRVARVSADGSRADAAEPDAAYLLDGRLVVRLAGVEHALCRADELAIRGPHNIANALMAAACALEAGVTDEQAVRGLRSFEALEHRIEPAGEVAGVRFINDSKATNTDSTIADLGAFAKGEAIVLLGGHDKHTDLCELSRVVCETAAAAVCFGEACERMAAALEACDGTFPVIRAPHMAEALSEAVAIAKAGQAVLLAPACSSFDEFSNYEERGRVFKRLVSELAAQGTDDGAR